MSLIILNGSPRGKKSNSSLLIRHFIEGYSYLAGEEVPVYYLDTPKGRWDATQAFATATHCLLVFPLYTDAMPAIVKEWLEQLYECEDKGGKQFGFIVQSGFGETIHSFAVERYLEKYSLRSKCGYIGTFIKAGVEGIQVMPPSMTRKLFANFNRLGAYFAFHQSFDPELMRMYRKPVKMPVFKRLLYPLLPSGLLNFYWNSHLKKYGAWEQRFDQPYLEKKNAP